ncbi:MAG: MaoC family dehydratase [Alphaproteobacteria bacterium]|nr:MaoC family dehydratase [Alphaproteobacteria bacterium]
MYTIDLITPGLSSSFDKVVSERDITMFGEVTGDMNPVHFDEAYATATPFKGRIAHGMLGGSLFSTILGTRLPGPGTIYMGQTLKFKAPVRIGDRVTATCTVREVVPEKRRVTLDCIARVGDLVVIEGEALVLAPARA